MHSKLPAPLFLIAILCGGLLGLADALAKDPLQDRPAPAMGASGLETGVDAADSIGAWRLVRSSAPGGAESAAILHTADFERSDFRLAGLMFRCARQDIEAVIVVVEPFPPHAQPQIILRSGEREANFVGTIIPTGAGIRLPDAAMRMLTGQWRNERELAIKVADGDTRFGGVITLSDLPKALQSLSVECSQK